MPHPMCGSEISSERDYFLRHVLPKLVKWLWPVQSNKREEIESILSCPKLAKWILTLNWLKSANDQSENLYISSHREARNINPGLQDIIKRANNPGQHYYKEHIRYSASRGNESLYLNLLRGYCYQICTVKSSVIEFDRVLLHWG